MSQVQQKIANFYRKTENSSCRIPEYSVLCIYILLLSVFMYFHEPWYDEAQAWLIARDASLREILFTIPHYEGHPPLWFLLLAAFAKSGANFDLTVKVLTLTFNAAAMILLLFRSPFPRYIRLLLPFTYFLFYQHGVICRPYSLLLLGFLLAATFWQVKEEKPFRFSLSLMLMCASSAYGIIFAGGISIVWLLELRRSATWRDYFRSLFHGRRFAAMLLLLLFALLNIFSILPRHDTFAASYGLSGDNPVWFRLLYMFFASVADATCFSSFEEYDELRYAAFSTSKLSVGCLIGAFLLILIYFYGRSCRKRLLFFLPFTLFAVFSGIVYFYLQHIDVLFQFLLFWCWVCRKEFLCNGPMHTVKYPRLSRLGKPILVVCVGSCLAISIFWTIAVCRNEIRYSYGFAKELANYLDNQGLSSYGIMVRWQQETDESGKIVIINTNQTVNGVAINAYYEDNIVVNMNGGDLDKPYVTHKIPTEKEVEETIREWREAGLPCLTLDRCQLKSVFPEYPDVYALFYTDVLTVSEYHLWKSGYIYTAHHLYVRNDIARKHFLTE